MSKILQILSFASLIILSLGTLYLSENAAFWLASGSDYFQIIRGAFILILSILIVTKPPRYIPFRFMVGIVSTAVLMWTVHEFYYFNLPLLDSLAYILASLTIIIAALEQKDIPDTLPRSRYANY